MLNLQLSFLFTILLAFLSKAQSPTPQPIPGDTVAIGKVTYAHQVHLSASAAKNGLAELYFNTTRSKYIHLGNPEEQGETYPDQDGNLIKAVDGDKQGAPIYKMHTERKMLYRDQRAGENGRWIVSDTFGGIAWNLHPEHKRIGIYDCRRATGMFHGREYEVWYTLDIPIPSGPFKLGGLPGLILDARTTDNSAEFSFVSIEFSKNLPIRIKPPFGKNSGLNYEAFRTAEGEYMARLVAEMKAKGNEIYFTFDPDALEVWDPKK